MEILVSETHPEIVDLTHEPTSRVQAAAFYALRGIRPGRTVELLTATEPELLMRSLDLQLGHRLAWTTEAQGPPWRTVVKHREDAPPADVVDLLQREHRRLDGLLAHATRLLNQGNATEAAPVLKQFVRDLTRHLQVEDEVITPALGPGAGRDEACAAMLREHTEIASQLKLIEDNLGGEEDATEVSTYCAILAGTLAKHEYREEQTVLPQWRVALAQRGAEEGAALLRQIRALLDR